MVRSRNNRFATVAKSVRRTLSIGVAFALALAITPWAHAQDASRPALHPELQRMMDEGRTDIPNRLRGRLGGHQGSKRLNGQEALDLHLRTTATREELDSIPGVRIRSLNDGRATATVLPRALRHLVRRPDVTSISLPRILEPNLQAATNVSGVRALRSETGGVWTGKTGAGVVVGVVDSGIDFDHPNFTDPAGDTRIAYLWDQTEDDPTRYPAAPYDYGTEWTAADIDAGLCTEEDESEAVGHGTHVTGIAAGNGAAPDENGDLYTHAGVAPEATIVFVKLDFGKTTGIVDALNYIFERADDLGMPAVINLSLGGSLGSHDGTSPEEEEIDTLVTAQNGRAVVVAAGNERDDEAHAEIAAQPLVSLIGPSFDIPTYTASSGSDNDLVLITGYYPNTDDLTVHLSSPNGDFYTHALNTGFGSPCTALTTGVDGSVQVCNNFTSQLGMGTGDREIIIVIVDDTAGTPPADGTWEILLTGNTVAGAGIVDFWMVSSLGDNGDTAFFSSHVEAAKTVAMPASSVEAITVGSYTTKICWEDSTGTARTYSVPPPRGDISPFSSAGPTRDGRSKPEIAAPGMGIVSALADEVRADLIAAGLGPIVITDDYLLLQGTSQAAPMVTGAVALLLEEDDTYSNADLKSLLRGAADEDAFTRLYDQPVPFLIGATNNYTFGAGKLDLGSWAWEDPFESNDLPARASSIVSGQLVEARLETDADKDFFVLEDLEVGDTADIELTNLPADYRLRLTEAFSSGPCEEWTRIPRATSDLGGTTDENLNFTLAAGSEPRYIRVDSSIGAFEPDLDYELKAVITRPEAAVFNNTTAAAQVLPSFDEFRIEGSVFFFDRDVYEIEARPVQTITASVSGAVFPLDVEILDATGAVVSAGVNAASHAVGIPFPGPLNLGPRTFFVAVDSPMFAFSTYDLEITILP